jgi:glycosyltransferase involved in cell wall biosynthesis
LEVTVVIPVFNAEEYLEQAVESALAQSQTKQVVLVEDGSTDDSLSVCKHLGNRYDRALLIRHPDGGSHGAGASRNLGIAAADTPFVAFLDADDYFLEDRFDRAQAVLKSDPGADGVYEAVGVCFSGEDSARKWESQGRAELTTMTREVPPGELCDALIGCGSGSFHLDGLVVRRGAFDRSGLFLESLRLHQDTAMTVQLAQYCRLVPGRLDEPVALRRIHPGNRYLSGYDPYRTGLELWRTLLRWAIRRELPASRLAAIFLNCQYNRYHLALGSHPSSKADPLQWFGLLLQTLAHPLLAGGALKERRRRRANRHPGRA